MENADLKSKIDQLKTTVVEKDKIIIHLTNDLKRTREERDKDLAKARKDRDIECDRVRAEERADADRILREHGIII